MKAPIEEPLIVSEPLKSTVSIPETYTEYRDATIAEAKKITAVTYPDDAQLSVAVASLRELTGIEKQVNDVEEGIRKPVNKWLKDVRLIRDTFLDSVIREKKRLTDLVNGFQTKAREAQQLRDREAREEQARAQRQAEEAQREIERQQQLAAQAKTAKAREAAEEALLAAQLAQETAALSAQSAEATLATPTNTPRGLTTRTRYDFEIIAAANCFNAMPEFWTYKREEELIKFDRAGFLKKLNAEEPEQRILALLPEDGQQSVSLPKWGLRIFLDTKIHLRA